MGLRASRSEFAKRHAVRDWAIFRGGTTRRPVHARAPARVAGPLLDHIRFTQAPVVRVTLNATRRIGTFGGAVTLDSVSATTPWGDFQNAGLRAYLKPANSNAPRNAEINLTADRASTRLGFAAKLDLNLLGHAAYG